MGLFKPALTSLRWDLNFLVSKSQPVPQQKGNPFTFQEVTGWRALAQLVAAKHSKTNQKLPDFTLLDELPAMLLVIRSRVHSTSPTQADPPPAAHQESHKGKCSISCVAVAPGQGLMLEPGG